METFKNNGKFRAYLGEKYSRTDEDEKGTVEHYLLKEISR